MKKIENAKEYLHRKIDWGDKYSIKKIIIPYREELERDTLEEAIKSILDRVEGVLIKEDGIEINLKWKEL